MYAGVKHSLQYRREPATVTGTLTVFPFVVFPPQSAMNIGCRCKRGILNNLKSNLSALYFAYNLPCFSHLKHGKCKYNHCIISSICIHALRRQRLFFYLSLHEGIVKDKIKLFTKYQHIKDEDWYIFKYLLSVLPETLTYSRWFDGAKQHHWTDQRRWWTQDLILRRL